MSFIIQNPSTENNDKSVLNIKILFVMNEIYIWDTIIVISFNVQSSM